MEASPDVSQSSIEEADLVVENSHSSPQIMKLSAEGSYIEESWQHYQQVLDINRHQETFEISQVFGFVAYIYEKIRATVENKQERVLRRFAIERALSRPDMAVKNNQQKAERLIKELTWSRFLPNNYVTQYKYNWVVEALDKYTQLYQETLQCHPNYDDRFLDEWLREVESTEIEEILVPAYTRRHLVPTLFLWLQTKFVWKINPPIDDNLRDTQLFIAAHRALAKSDRPILKFYLFKLFYPDWEELDTLDIPTFANQMPETIEQIENLIDFKNNNQFFRFVQRNSAPFIFLEALMQKKDAVHILKDKTRFDQTIRKIAGEKYARIKKDIRKGIVNSILYIFATKVVIAFLIEYPYEQYILGEIHWSPILINMTLPPALMFVMGLTITAPKSDNTARVIEKLHQIIYQKDQPDKPYNASINLNSATKRWSLVFTLIWAYLFVMFSMALFYFLMEVMHFNPVSAGLFFVFLSLVLLFGFRLRWQAQELLVAKPQQNIFVHLISMVSIPFINMGLWLSASFSKINVITFVFDKLIDSPLKTSVNSAEEWTNYLKDRQEEVVEIPQH